MTSQRMADSEIMARVEATHGEMRAGFIDIRGDLKSLNEKVSAINGRVQGLQLWQAEVRGSLRMLSIMVGIGIAVPGSVGATVGVLVATGVIK